LSFEIRAAAPEEFPDVVTPIFHYFGSKPDPDFVERLGRLLPAELIVGSGAAFPFETGVPGGFVRAAGVTLVGVLPTHRRRGILRGLMRTQLDDIHERGEPMAYLWALEDALYGRYGYGIASFSGNVELRRDRASFYRDFEPTGRIRLVEVDEAVGPFGQIQRRPPHGIRACSSEHRSGGGRGGSPIRSGGRRVAARWSARCSSSTAGLPAIRYTGCTFPPSAGSQTATPA
jgi:predicted N-acetyltransferase YhbS